MPPTGDRFCPCGCGAWLGQCQAPRYRFERFLSVTKAADANLLAELDPRDGDCTTDGCWCGGSVAKESRS